MTSTYDLKGKAGPKICDLESKMLAYCDTRCKEVNLATI